MTNFMIAYEKLTKAQDAFDLLCDNLNNARNALKRSKSKKNQEAYQNAEKAWNDAFDQITALHEACSEADALDHKIALEKIKAEDEYRQPNLL